MPVKVRYSDELYHYGIEGMKWGIRRYQNPDGSYTQEGLERYGRLGKDASKSVVKQLNKDLRDKHDALENFDSFLKETPDISDFHKRRWLNADPDTYASYYANTANTSIFNNIDPYLVMDAIIVNLLD